MDDPPLSNWIGLIGLVLTVVLNWDQLVAAATGPRARVVIGVFKAVAPPLLFAGVFAVLSVVTSAANLVIFSSALSALRSSRTALEFAVLWMHSIVRTLQGNLDHEALTWAFYGSLATSLVAAVLGVLIVGRLFRADGFALRWKTLLAGSAVAFALMLRLEFWAHSIVTDLGSQ